MINIGWVLCGKRAPGHLLCDFLALQEALLQDLYPSSPFLPKTELLISFSIKSIGNRVVFILCLYRHFVSLKAIYFFVLNISQAHCCLLKQSPGVQLSTCHAVLIESKFVLSLLFLLSGV